MKAAEWIDRLKAERGWESDYRAAKELGLSRNTISNYRSGTRTLDDDTAIKVAEALDVQPEIILLDQVTERTKSEPAKAALTGLLAKITGKNLSGLVGGSGDGRGRLDITSVTQVSEDGDLRAPRSKRYASCKLPIAPRRGPLSPLAQLARALLQLPAAPVGAFA